MKNTLTILTTIVFVWTLQSCSKENTPTTLKDMAEQAPASLVLGATAEMLPVEYLEADAFNIAVINSNTININRNNPDERAVSAVSFYKMGDSPGQIASLQLNGAALPYMSDWIPSRYFQDWNNSGPNFNDLLVWDFKEMPNDTIVHDTIDVPSTLGAINIGTNTSFNRNGNTTLYWENGTVGGQIGVAIQWYVVDPVDGLLGQGGQFVKVVDDNGLCEITPQDLLDAEVPPEATRLNVRLYRMNSRCVVTYANGTKKATAVAIVERSYSAPIE